MARYLLRLMYDGTEFYGWQRQKERRSVQGVLEQALADLTGHPTPVTGSGRTDSGVHAIAQYAHFDTDTGLTPEIVHRALNAKLPNDLRVLTVWTAPDDFHARYRATARSYRYLLARKYLPLSRNYTGFLPKVRLFPKRMHELVPVLLGSHDFSSLSKENPSVRNRICELRQLEITDCDVHIRFDVLADRFLHHMVRRIVGTLANLAQQDLGPEVLQRILEERNPRQTLVLTAPAEGLYLTGVCYPELQLDESGPAELW